MVSCLRGASKFPPQTLLDLKLTTFDLNLISFSGLTSLVSDHVACQCLCKYCVLAYLKITLNRNACQIEIGLNETGARMQWGLKLSMQHQPKILYGLASIWGQVCCEFVYALNVNELMHMHFAY